MNDIIVIGVTHHNTLTMVRCLGKVGYGMICIFMVATIAIFVIQSMYKLYKYE